MAKYTVYLMADAYLSCAVTVEAESEEEAEELAIKEAKAYPVGWEAGVGDAYWEHPDGAENIEVSEINENLEEEDDEE
ncbi:MAG TPA: hypothetical protein VH593_16705 [Ktedonobacteraceae bacterium]|jgi:hypothetical protein